ncbi:MAG: WG repeat-containing protein [Cyanobacteriota bacterium]
MNKKIISSFVFSCFFLINNEISYANNDLNKDSSEIKNKITQKIIKLDSQIDSVYGFSEGLAVIKNKSGRYGFINKEGKFVIKPIFVFAKDFKEGLAPVHIENKSGGNNKLGFIDKNGKFVIEPKYEYSYDFNEGLVPVGLNDKWGFIDKNGKEVIPLIYEMATSFRNGLARVAIKKKYGFIDKTGKLVIPAKFDNVDDFQEDLSAITIDEKMGFINKKGDIVIPPELYYYGSFYEGLSSATVNYEDKVGFINKKGEYVIPPKFDESVYFSEGLAYVKIKNKYGFIDKTGKLVIPAKFDMALNFENKLAYVEVNKKIGFINKKGDFIIPPILKMGFITEENPSFLDFGTEKYLININGENKEKSLFELVEKLNNSLKIDKPKADNKSIDIKIKKTKKVISEQDIAINYIIAQKYNNSKEFEKTIELLGNINQESELNDEINTLLSIAYLELGRKEIRNLNPEKAIKNLILGKSSVNKIKNDIKVKKELDELISKGLKYAPMYKGVLFINNKKYKEAEKEFQKLIKSDPQNADYYDQLGMVKYYLGNKNEAIKLMEKSIDLSKDKYIGYYDLACLYSLNNDKKLAIKNLAISIKLKPDLKQNAIKDEQLDNIRNSEEFRKLIK